MIHLTTFDLVDVEAAMTQASGGPDARALVVTGKSPAADGVAAVTLARPSGGRLPDWTPGAHIDLVLPGGLSASRRTGPHPAAPSSRARACPGRKPRSTSPAVTWA
jgi:hypothetical protein